MVNFKSKRSKENTVFEVTEAEELLPFLLQSFNNRSRNSVKSLLTRGQVYVNERAQTQHNYGLKPGDKVMIRWVTTLPKETGITVIYEDEDVLIIDKPSGLLTIATDKERERTAYHQLTTYIKNQDARQRLFIVHRLDKETSGVMMFAKSMRAKERMQNEWRERVTKRTYIALVEGRVSQKQGTITSWLQETKTHRMYSSKKTGDGQKAITHYKVLRTSGHYSLLEVHLETGRKNQIRVHMQEMGHPIVGDKLYGAKTKAIGRLGLHAAVLAFKHPKTNQIKSFESPVPEVFFKPFKGR
ncbi:pseudouridine synthase [Pullulanibacillus camelliae]|uniref:Pseudouridine synthase n=1 Tax=Pullulanibacillus camelliae TaxID=1707096 RepID=A0A8J2YI99_9BACL|nr:RluA family pseudouridine synthase [Pullulanibacillus camelliae]GGE44924.1 pseudouridine synthase [Pullulanibacillus camelliae]